jgi:hypothetical protein
MATSYLDFLLKHTTKDNSKITHTRIGDKDLTIHGGCYHIPKQQMQTFYNLYYNYVFVQEKNEYLTEKQPISNCPFVVDLDFRYTYEIQTRQHTKKHIEDLIYAYMYEFKNYFIFEENTPFDVFIFEKDNVNRLADGSLTKDGIHILIGLNIDHTMQVLIRDTMIKKIETILEDLPLINTYESVLDEGISKGSTNWQLFGSKKPNNEPYKLKYQYQVTYDKCDGEFMYQEKNVADFDLTNNFIRLSVQNENCPKFEINPKCIDKYNTLLNTKNLKNKTSFKPISPSPTSVTAIDSDFTDWSYDEKRISELLDIIGSSMCCEGKQREWTMVAQPLKNMFGQAGFKIWKKWTDEYATSNKKLECDEWWDKITGTITEGSLQYWAKSVNENKYREWVSKYFKKTKFGDYADYLYGYVSEKKQNISIDYRDEKEFADLIYDTTKGKVYLLRTGEIVVYHNKEWNILDQKEPRLLKHIIISIFESYILICLDFFNDLIKKTDDNDVLESLKKLYKSICDLKGSIKKKTFVNNICSLLLNKLSSHKTEIEFDVGSDNYYNIHFKNGVYDLKIGEFRERKETDYITQYLDYDYIPENALSQQKKDCVFDFFKKIQPDEQQRNFTLSYLYYCITGDTNKQIFKMNVGHTASNGKSTELAIHEKCFDIYTKKLDKRVFEKGFEKRHKYIIDCFNKPIRLAYVEELANKKLDKDFIKDWVDGRKVNCEVMFGTNIEMKPQAKLLSCSNYDPNFDNDNGIKRRGKLQHYKSQFVKPELVDEENHKYEKVEGFENIFDDVEYKNAYFHLLLKYKDLQVPKENEEEFADVVEDNDELLNFIEEYFEITKNKEDRELKKVIETEFGKEKAKEMIAKFKQLGCDYKKDLSKDNQKGVILGIKMKPKNIM